MRSRSSAQPVPHVPRRRLALHLQIAVRRAGLPGAAQFRRWARSALRQPAEVTVRIVGVAEARALNRRYRGRDHATNVLSFSYGSSRRAVNGDVVLCAPVIARESLAQQKTLEAHFAHLTVHGLLHLQGHDHGNARDAARMEALEKRVLAKLGYPDPYDANRKS